ncbi:MAG: ACT domain-containing protein [Bacillota bacterium]|nr:ACT domain-containing protein [Bacillota bacterium]
MKAIITVIGKDQIGIISGTSNVLSECSINILDISQTIMQSFFTMIMLVDLSKSTLPFAELQKKLNEKGDTLGVKITIQHEDIFKSMHSL